MFYAGRGLNVRQMMQKSPSRKKEENIEISYQKTWQNWLNMQTSDMEKDHQ